MRAVFVASGPSFRNGAVLPPFDNVDVYPLLMWLLGLPPEPNDGDADALAALRADPDSGAARLHPGYAPDTPTTNPDRNP